MSGKEPLSIQALSEEASNFEYNPNIPLRYWLRTADAIQKQAQSYDRDGNEQDAYLFYLRHATLLLEKLSNHPDIKLSANRVAYNKATKDLRHNVARLEYLKPTIMARHELFTQAVALQKREREEWAGKQQAGLVGSSSAQAYDPIPVFDHRRRSSQKRIRKELFPGHGGNEHVALSLARKEQRKRRANEPDRERDAQESQFRRDQDDRPRPSHEDAADDLTRQIVEARKRGDNTFMERNGSYSSSGTTFAPKKWNYPTVPRTAGYGADGDKASSLPSNLLHAISPMRTDSQQSYAAHDPLIPVRPPKEYFGLEDAPIVPPKERAWSNSLQSQPPPVPGKILTPDHWDPSTRSSTATPDINSQDYTFAPSAKTEAGAPLRTVFISPDLRRQFLNIAQPNTNRNLETCGILCGTLISNAFFISKLVIPDQEATSDTCDTVNEEALFEYCDAHDLMTLGWIHTHPTQTCFMSSRDLHTHGGYQVQMAESIAIVCAPTMDPSFGIFRLTDPPGLKTILNCRKPGLFHPHDVDDVYTSALKPGHVSELPGLEFEVVDLRPKAR